MNVFEGARRITVIAATVCAFAVGFLFTPTIKTHMCI